MQFLNLIESIGGLKRTKNKKAGIEENLSGLNPKLLIKIRLHLLFQSAILHSVTSYTSLSNKNNCFEWPLPLKSPHLRAAHPADRDES
jgi:hypothetical protein